MADIMEEAARRGLSSECLETDQICWICMVTQNYRKDIDFLVRVFLINLLQEDLQHPTSSSRGPACIFASLFGTCLFCIRGTSDNHACGQCCLLVKGHTSGNQGPIS